MAITKSIQLACTGRFSCLDALEPLENAPPASLLLRICLSCWPFQHVPAYSEGTSEEYLAKVGWKERGLISEFAWLVLDKSRLGECMQSGQADLIDSALTPNSHLDLVSPHSGYQIVSISWSSHVSTSQANHSQSWRYPQEFRWFSQSFEHGQDRDLLSSYVGWSNSLSCFEVLLSPK